MDMAIETTGVIGAMTWDKATTILNNVYLSLMVPRGGWWFNPEFGSRLHLLTRAKNTERTALLAREYCREALQWLLDTRRATAVEVEVERDRLQDLHRLKIVVRVTQADGSTVSFETFREVV
jgi:phage gp46-like protein